MDLDKKKRRTGMILALLAVLISGCNQPAPTQTVPPPTVTREEISSQTVQRVQADNWKPNLDAVLFEY